MSAARHHAAWLAAVLVLGTLQAGNARASRGEVPIAQPGSPSRASMRGMTKRLVAGTPISQVAVAGGVIALHHVTPRANLGSILRAGALVPASRRAGAAVATRDGDGGLTPLGGYGFNRVFLSATGLRSVGVPLFARGGEEARTGLAPGSLDLAMLLFSVDLLDHPPAGLSHLGLGWRYGDDSHGVRLGDAPGLARFLHAVAGGEKNELVWKRPVPLTALRAILVPPGKLEKTRAALAAAGVALPPGVHLIGADRLPGCNTAARRWLRSRPERVTRTREGYVEVEEL